MTKFPYLVITTGVIIVLLIYKSLTIAPFARENQLSYSFTPSTPNVDSTFSFWAPLTESIQLFGYSDRINHGVCTSIESAILAGWEYQLIGPTVSIQELRNSNGVPIFDGKMKKMFALSTLLKIMPQNVTIVFADSLDILFQRSFIDFQSFLSKSGYNDGNIVYSAENNCWPFSRSNKKTYSCPVMQGKNFRPNMNDIGLGCKLQAERYQLFRQKTQNQTRMSDTDTVYLNSGLSLGLVSNYRKVADKVLDMLTSYPRLCIDDQGLLAWQLVKDNVKPMVLDYKKELFVALNDKQIFFDPSDGLFKIWHDDMNVKNNISNLEDMTLHSIPFLIHFNGAGKPQYNISRNRIVEWKNNTFGVLDYLKNKTFYLDGIQKNFTDVCNNYVKSQF